MQKNSLKRIIIALVLTVIMAVAFGVTAVAVEEPDDSPAIFHVTYAVEGDLEFGYPEDYDEASVPVDGNDYGYNDNVTVAGNMTTECDYYVMSEKYGEYAGEKAVGVWTFEWDTGDFAITEDTVITGTWHYAPDEGVLGEQEKFRPGDNGETKEPEDDDVPVEEEIPEEYEPPVNPDVPKTGDNAELLLWLMLTVLSGCGAAATAVMKKKADI